MFGRERMYERRVLFIVFAVLLACFCANSCTTRPVIVATDEPVRAGQISTARIEAINGECQRILQLYDSLVGRAQSNAIRGIDDALEALDRYDQFVRDCIFGFRAIERELREGKAESQNLLADSADNYNR